MMTLAQAITAWAERQAQAAVKARAVRAWNAGGCVKALWYGEHGYEPLPGDAQGHLRLDLGRRIEDAMCVYAEYCQVSIAAPKFRRAHSRDIVEMPGRGKVCPDGFVSGEPYGYPGMELWWDCKSMAAYPFEKTQAEGFDYYLQAQFEVYCRAYKMPAGVVTCYAKDTSLLHEAVYVSSDEVWARCERDLATAKASAMPARPDMVCSCGGTGKTKHKQPRVHDACAGTGYAMKDGGLPKGVVFLPTFPCGFCGYRLDCFGNCEEVKVPGWQGEEKTRLRPVEQLAEQLKASTEVKF